jgi:hypothetical protein
VTPVDYKAGAPKIGPETNELWDADKMQLGLQILILRDNGYTSDEGVIYYRATRQRVPLRMTQEIEAWIIAQIARARELAASPTIPPPLVNSPKCVRCSLAPVCLPDETRMLQGTLISDFRSQMPNAVRQIDKGSPLGSEAHQISNLKSQIPPRRLVASSPHRRTG